MIMYIIYCYAFVICFFGVDANGTVPLPTSHDVRVLTYVNERTKDGYHFRYDTEEGVFREETGQLVTKGNKKVLVVHGQYSYIGTDGWNYEVTYRADENGYRANATRKVLDLLAPQINSALLGSLAGGGIG